MLDTTIRNIETGLRMSKGYIVCVYESIDSEDILKNYALKTKDAVEKFDGKYLIKGGKNITTEGTKFIRTAVIEFPSFDIAKKFFNSKEYQNAHSLLKDNVVRHHQIINGL